MGPGAPCDNPFVPPNRFSDGFDGPHSEGWVICQQPFVPEYTVALTSTPTRSLSTRRTLTAQVVSANGQAVGDAPLAFTVGATDPQAPLGAVNPATGLANAEGVFTATFTFANRQRAHANTVAVSCEGCVNTATLNISIEPVNLLGFFNGVANTEDSANESLNRLQRELGPERNGTPLQYELFYNQTGCGSGTLGAAACLEDIFEVFAQRDRELQGVLADRWEIFWELLGGTHTQGSSLTGRLLGLLGGAGNALLQLIDTTFSAMLNQLVGVTGRLLTSPPTAANTAAHVARLQDHADQELGLVLVAHSQGNLFVNAAFDGLRAARPNAAAQVVHVAPASPTLRGDYTLADIDLVINGLRTTGVNSVPPANLTLPTSRSDLSGHMLEGTYLDNTRAAFARVKGMITTALDAL